ncbi:PrpF domain-containing protein [Streptomyces sp. NBC_00838]|uniref:PrpF domain-containing protein n=1 Tax=Streptomyces sp. NBC_00838 TaxID=2903680 RepID=UPI00386B8304|nr:PrpF domain-containing protein [Streptomyces sp. NBC_00838]
MLRLPATLMRGGTSKCWVFDADDLRAAGVTGGPDGRLDTVLASAFGATDPRQIDGVGGATSTTSKAVIVRPSAEPGVDVDYLFAQVGIGTAGVEWASNCGNCATAVGLYTLRTGLAKPVHPTTTVEMRNENTGVRLSATVPTPGGVVPELGEATVPGSRALGVPVALGFRNPAGASTGALLPTGNGVDRLEVVDEAHPVNGSRPPYGSHPAYGVDVTLVDAGAPAVLADAAALGSNALESVEAFSALVPTLTRLRRAAALRMGLAGPHDPISHSVPKAGVVAPAGDYVTSLGERISGADYDIAVRMLSMHAPHPAIGLTSAVAVASAALSPDTILAKLAENRPVATLLRLGTPAGVITAEVSLDGTGAVRAVTLHRAARAIATAELLVPALLQESV